MTLPPERGFSARFSRTSPVRTVARRVDYAKTRGIVSGPTRTEVTRVRRCDRIAEVAWKTSVSEGSCGSRTSRPVEHQDIPKKRVRNDTRHGASDRCAPRRRTRPAWPRVRWCPPRRERRAARLQCLAARARRVVRERHAPADCDIVAAAVALSLDRKDPALTPRARDRLRRDARTRRNPRAYRRAAHERASRRRRGRHGRAHCGIRRFREIA